MAAVHQDDDYSGRIEADISRLKLLTALAQVETTLPEELSRLTALLLTGAQLKPRPGRR